MQNVYISYKTVNYILKVDGSYGIRIEEMSRSMTKPTKWHVRLAKTQISLDIRPVWSESS